MTDKTLRGALPPLPKVGPICYAMRADIELYQVPRVGEHLVGVYDVALWSTDQMRAYATLAMQSALAQQPAEGATVHQFRRRGCADWHDGLPDHSDGGGPYETRVLHTAPTAQAQEDEDKRDAERYRWLREQRWYDSEICCVMKPKASVRLGANCPSGALLDETIDAAIASQGGEG